MLQSLGDLHPAYSRLAESVWGWSHYAAQQIEVPFSVLSERATLLGYEGRGQRSANGCCRILRCQDAWLAINLPRSSDCEAVGALLCEIAQEDAWTQLEDALPKLDSRTVVAQARLLGMPVARIGEACGTGSLPGPPRNGIAAGRWERTPQVVDLSSLWAGPLCGAILAQSGCEVTKVDIEARKDTTAMRSIEFDRRLNGEKRRLTLDPRATNDLDQLKAMIIGADVVITNARQRGLVSLGVFDQLVSSNTCWIAITAHDDDDRTGFGDDCAAAGNLVGVDDTGVPVFVGDALADPLTGIAAAATALSALSQRLRGRFRLSLAGVAAACSASQANAYV